MNFGDFSEFSDDTPQWQELLAAERSRIFNDARKERSIWAERLLTELHRGFSVCVSYDVERLRVLESKEDDEEVAIDATVRIEPVFPQEYQEGYRRAAYITLAPSDQLDTVSPVEYLRVIFPVKEDFAITAETDDQDLPETDTIFLERKYDDEDAPRIFKIGSYSTDRRRRDFLIDSLSVERTNDDMPPVAVITITDDQIKRMAGRGIGQQAADIRLILSLFDDALNFKVQHYTKIL